MSKKQKRSTKFQASADSLSANRARIERTGAVLPPTADSRVLWDSAPIVLKHIELRCEVIELTLAHPTPLMLLKAIDRFSRLMHFEICKRNSLPTVEAFVRRAESAFAFGLANYFHRAGQQSPASFRPTTNGRPTASAGYTLVIGCTGTGKSRAVSKLLQRFPHIDHE